MDNNQQDITSDLTDKQLALCYISAFEEPGTCLQDSRYAGYRAVAALAREGWRPIPKDEGFPMTLHQPRSNPCPLVETAADGEAEQLAKQLHQLAGILESLQIPQWPGRVLRAAELLVRQQVPVPVPASEKPCEREGWHWRGNLLDGTFRG